MLSHLLLAQNVLENPVQSLDEELRLGGVRVEDLDYEEAECVGLIADHLAHLVHAEGLEELVKVGADALFDALDY